MASSTLLTDLQRELRALEDDLRQRVDDDAEGTRAGQPVRYGEELRAEHRAAVQAGRTSATFGAWRDEVVTQAAVSWLLGCVFVRFCEDNALVAPVWLAGPDERQHEAADAQQAYFLAHRRGGCCRLAAPARPLGDQGEQSAARGAR